jgi:hypothetical protein
MITLTIILSFLLIYCISICGAYKFIQKAYFHHLGKWSKYNNVPDKDDRDMIFIPGVNTAFSIAYLFGKWKWEDLKQDDYTNFFKPKSKI